MVVTVMEIRNVRVRVDEPRMLVAVAVPTGERVGVYVTVVAVVVDVLVVVYPRLARSLPSLRCRDPSTHKLR